MGIPVIGQIRSFRDAQRALESIRGWFTSNDFSSQVTNIIRTTTTSSQQTGSDVLRKSANLSDVNSAVEAFNNIKQEASENYFGVTKLATESETIAGINAVKAVTPASLASKIDTDPLLAADSDDLLASQKATKGYVDSKIIVMQVRCHISDLTLKYMPLSVDRMISGHLSDGTAITIPLVSGA